MKEELAPWQVAKELREQEDRELTLDLMGIIQSFPSEEQQFLKYYSEGYTPAEAVRQVGATNKNPKRWFRQVLMKLTERANA